jgi:hypothetical protein
LEIYKCPKIKKEKYFWKNSRVQQEILSVRWAKKQWVQKNGALDILYLFKYFVTIYAHKINELF